MTGRVMAFAILPVGAVLVAFLLFIRRRRSRI
jgi:hypothetical protein